MHLCVWSRSTSGTDDLCEMNKNLFLAHEILEERYVAYKTKAEKCHVSQPLSVFIPGTRSTEGKPLKLSGQNTTNFVIAWYCAYLSFIDAKQTLCINKDIFVFVNWSSPSGGLCINHSSQIQGHVPCL